MSEPQWGSPAAIYAIDKVTAATCTAMSQVGFAFDRERAEAYASWLNGQIDAAAGTINETVGRSVKPLSPKDLGAAFFGDLRAPIYFRSKLTGKPSLGIDAMRGYAASQRPELARAALAVLHYRRLRKVRSTYVLSALALANEERDHRVHPSWLNYGAVSGRWSCQGPNLANLPRGTNDPCHKASLGGMPGGEGIRSLYVAPPGYVLVAFDASQLEIRIAAYTSGDAKMIAACETADIHAANAATIWPGTFEAADPELRAELRQLAKSAGLAVNYDAGALTIYTRIVAEGKIAVTLPQCEAMLQKLRRGFKGFFDWKERELLNVIRTGYAREYVTGRRRWMGHDPEATEAGNHPIQGGAAGVLNTRLPAICRRLQLDSQLREAKLVASVYDSGVFEVREQHAERVAAVCREVFEAPVRFRSTDLDGVFPVEIKISNRWK